MTLYTIYWRDDLNYEPGEEFEEFRVYAKNKTEARNKGKRKAFRNQLKEYNYRIKQRKKGDMIPLMKKPKLKYIVIEEVEEE